MRGSAAFRVGVAPGGALAPSWVRDSISRAARSAPSLDLRFADNKSLVDAVSGGSLVTFTRASSGTYVGSDGLIKTATTNLLLQSEDFSTTWAPTDATVTTNSIAAPNGASTADTYTEGASGTPGVFQAVTGLTAATVYTGSLFIKRGNNDWYRLLFVDNSTFANGARAWFNTATGTFGTAENIGTGGGVATSVTPFGDSWWRISLSTSMGGSNTAFRFQINSATANGSATRVFSSVSYLWGAQLEQSSTVGEYVKTTTAINSAPRFDHNPTTGESLGLLVEESRTNLLLQSNGFNTTWTNTSSSETAAAGTSPDGTNTAWEFKDTSDGSATTHRLDQSASFTSGVSYTLSIYGKIGSIQGIHLLFPSSAFGVDTRINFDLSLGTASVFAGTATASITNAGNGWYRCVATATASSTTSSSIQLRTMKVVSGTLSSFYQGDGTGTILIWGAQLEAGSFPTSYIPTTTAAVTRSADVASITGTNFSSWYRQDEGTMFIETQLQSTVARNAAGVDLNDNSTNNRSIFRAFTTGSFDQYIVRSGGSAVATIASASTPSFLVRKSTIAYKVDDFAITAEGLTPNTDTSGAVPVAVNQAFIGSALSGTEFLGGHVRRLTYWPTRLSNSTLQTITR
jgi:hypothetical protein